ncbi:hypothetical protein [Luteococcus sp. OSA5]|uniref:hypothetical protein n=1 Tax=Luteococcus sp. OSA5 TaxID=3401630 RepID=UPI003B4324D1
MMLPLAAALTLGSGVGDGDEATALGLGVMLELGVTVALGVAVGLASGVVGVFVGEGAGLCGVGDPLASSGAGDAEEGLGEPGGVGVGEGAAWALMLVRASTTALAKGTMRGIRIG